MSWFWLEVPIAIITKILCCISTISHEVVFASRIPFSFQLCGIPMGNPLNKIVFDFMTSVLKPNFKYRAFDNIDPAISWLREERNSRF